MPDLNANIPYLWGYVRDSYLHAPATGGQPDPAITSLTECYVFGAKAIINRPLGFHVQLDNGAVFWSLPLSAIVWKPDFEPLSADENERLSLLQWWDCQSSSLAVTVFKYLEGYTVDCRNRNGDWMRGRYLFTIDDHYADANALPVGYAEDQDAKCFHLIQLDNGNYAAYPNNYLRWHNLNHVTPYDTDNPPKYKANGWDMRCEYIGPAKA